MPPVLQTPARDGDARAGAGSAAPRQADRRAIRRTPRRFQKRRIPRAMRPINLHVNPSWLAAAASAGLLGLFGLQRYGWRLGAGFGALGLLGFGHMALGEPTRPILERIELRPHGLPRALDGLRIGHISDTHLGYRYAPENLIWALEELRRERPDLIALTGDFVNFAHAIPTVGALLRGVSAPLGVYAVPGNHDHDEGLGDLEAALALAGVPLLLNENRRLQWNGGELWLIGIDDIWHDLHDLEAALAGVPEDAFTLLLAHAPDVADEAAQRRIGVQLSGHTHGGHLRLPLLGPFSLPRYGRRYVIGEYLVGTTTVYVSRGLAGAPLRLLCPPEATIITLRSDQ
jgi:hypothetical protein